MEFNWAEFLAGMVVGSILGVVADRAWLAVEKRTRLRITCGSYGNETLEGMTVTVKNEGKTILPPFRIALFNPKLGTLFFGDRLPEQLHPGQEFYSKVRIFNRHKLISVVYGWSTKAPNGTPMTPADDQNFRFRLVIENGDLILYENHRLGVDFVAALKNHVDRGLGKEPGREHGLLISPPQSFAGWLQSLAERRPHEVHDEPMERK